MPPNSTLDAIGLKYGTDKASFGHNYLDFYEIFFAPLRKEKLNVLEIGVLNGASTRTWEEYFPESKIIGADIDPTTKRFEQGRVTIELLDQSNIEELTRVAVKHGPFDIIIEDGSHMWEHQITSLRTLFPFLKHDGLYIVEDLQTNYGSMTDQYKGSARTSCVDYLKAWLDLRVADDQIPIDAVEDAFLRTYGRAIQFIAFYRRACLIKKRFPPVSRATSVGQPLVAGSLDSHSVALRIVAHISNRGDVFGDSGYINLGSDELSLQGLLLDSGQDLLEYRVRGPDDSWSAWSRDNGFVGTRGQAKILTGVAVRLRDHAKDRYSLRIFCRFVGSESPVEFSDGQDCTSSGAALVGVQVELQQRAQES
jgi:hypothetical protein